MGEFLCLWSKSWAEVTVCDKLFVQMEFALKQTLLAS